MAVNSNVEDEKFKYSPPNDPKRIQPLINYKKKELTKMAINRNAKLPLIA